jgi:hypothetical protein
VTVRTRDRGADRYLRAARELAKGPAVDVGVIGQHAAEAHGAGEGITVAMVAEWAELGLGQPMRSWLRGWIEESGPEIEKRLAAETKAVLAGTRTREQALARVGVWAVGEIQKRIAAGIAPPNAESTIDKKGSSTPLIDKGQLRSSITSRVVR